MAALDSLMLSQHVNISSWGPNQTIPVPDENTMGDVGYGFIAEASVEYNKVNPQFPSFTVETARTCGNFWALNQEFVFNRARLLINSNIQYSIQEAQFFVGAGVDIVTFLNLQAGCASV